MQAHQENAQSTVEEDGVGEDDTPISKQEPQPESVSSKQLMEWDLCTDVHNPTYTSRAGSVCIFRNVTLVLPITCIEGILEIVQDTKGVSEGGFYILWSSSPANLLQGDVSDNDPQVPPGSLNIHGSCESSPNYTPTMPPIKPDHDPPELSIDDTAKSKTNTSDKHERKKTEREIAAEKLPLMSTLMKLKTNANKDRKWMFKEITAVYQRR